MCNRTSLATLVSTELLEEYIKTWVVENCDTFLELVIDMGTEQCKENPAFIVDRSELNLYEEFALVIGEYTKRKMTERNIPEENTPKWESK